MKIEITRFRSGSPKLMLLLNIPKNFCCPVCSRFVFENPNGREYPKVSYEGENRLVSVHCYCDYEIKLMSAGDPGKVFAIAYQIMEMGSGVLVNFRTGSEATAMTLMPLSEK